MLPTFQENIEDIRKKLTEIGESLVKANSIILEALQSCNEKEFQEARNSIKNISSKADAIDNAIIKVLALYTPEAKDLRRVVAYFKINNELSRACSNTRNFIRGFSDLCKDLDVKEINEYAILMQTSTLKAIATTVKMLSSDDIDELQEMYEEVLIEENKADDLYGLIERKLVQEAEGSSTFEKYHQMLKALRKSEKIANRAISVANLLLYIEIGGNIHK